MLTKSPRNSKSEELLHLTLLVWAEGQVRSPFQVAVLTNLRGEEHKRFLPNQPGFALILMAPAAHASRKTTKHSGLENAPKNNLRQELKKKMVQLSFWTGFVAEREKWFHATKRVRLTD